MSRVKNGNYIYDFTYMHVYNIFIASDSEALS